MAGHLSKRFANKIKQHLPEREAKPQKLRGKKFHFYTVTGGHGILQVDPGSDGFDDLTDWVPIGCFAEPPGGAHVETGKKEDADQPEVGGKNT